MKVVINKCYGGFGVSPRCLWELVQAKSAAAPPYDMKKYFGGDNLNFAHDWEQRRDEQLSRAKNYAATQENLPALPAGWVIDPFVCVLYDLNGGSVYSVDSNGDARTDPTLIRLIEERGSEWASGSLAKLAVVEIPDGTEYEIDEYDGIEHIAETHRTWS